MPSPENRTASRRRAIGASALATIVAGLLGSAGTTTAEASAPANPTLAAVVNFEALAAESLRLVALCREAQQATGPASEALKARIGEDHYRLAMEYVEGPHDAQRDVFHDLLIAELCRHLPGMAPAIGVLWLHILESSHDAHGRCCVDSFDGRA